MTTKNTKKTAEITFLKGRLQKINKVLGKFEAEVEKAVTKFMKRGEKSSQLLRKQFDEIIEKISASDFYSKANEKSEEILSEIKRLADEAVAKLKDFDIRVAKPLIKEIRQNIEELISKLQSAEIVEIARDRVVNTKNQLLTVLSIPSQKDVDDLSQKVVRLEKKIKSLTDKAAA